MPYQFTVEEAIETFQRFERGELPPTKALEEKLRRMQYELEFRADYTRIPPGYSSTGLYRVAEQIEKVLADFPRRRREYEAER
jgi:hypothetical protein